MGKMRVHELAKELGLENRALLDILAKKRVEVKNHMNSLEESVVSDIRREFGRKAGEGKPAASTPKTPVRPVEKAEPETAGRGRIAGQAETPVKSGTPESAA